MQDQPSPLTRRRHGPFLQVASLVWRGRFLWPSLLPLLIAAGPVATVPNKPGFPTVRQLADRGDTAVFRITWPAPVVDAQHPAATFYHDQVILGDSMPHQVLSGYQSSGVTFGYSNVARYFYPIAALDTFRYVRPPKDSVGPFTVAVQAAVGAVSCFPGCPFTLSPYIFGASFYVRVKQFPPPNPPGVPITDSVGLGGMVTCSVDSATARSIGLVKVSVRPARTTWVPNSFRQFCCFGTLADGRKVKFKDSWNDPYCESLYQQFLAEWPA